MGSYPRENGGNDRERSNDRELTVEGLLILLRSGFPFMFQL